MAVTVTPWPRRARTWPFVSTICSVTFFPRVVAAAMSTSFASIFWYFACETVAR